MLDPMYNPSSRGLSTPLDVGSATTVLDAPTRYADGMPRPGVLRELQAAWAARAGRDVGIPFFVPAPTTVVPAHG